MGQPQNQGVHESLVEQLQHWSEHSADPELASLLEEARREIVLLRMRVDVGRPAGRPAND